MFKFLMLLAFVQAAFVPEETEAMRYTAFQAHLKGKLARAFGYHKANYAMSFPHVRKGYWRLYKHYGMNKFNKFLNWQKWTARWWKARKSAWKYYKKHGWHSFWRVYHRSALRTYGSREMWRACLKAGKYVARW